MRTRDATWRRKHLRLGKGGQVGHDASDSGGLLARAADLAQVIQRVQGLQLHRCRVAAAQVGQQHRYAPRILHQMTT